MYGEITKKTAGMVDINDGPYQLDESQIFGASKSRKE
jgi:hypothetical protein